MIKVLIIGKNSFIGSNLFNDFKNKVFTKKISFYQFKSKKIKYIKNFTHIINCSINPEYIKNNYNNKFDVDLYIANKIKKFDIKYIFFSSRKIYQAKYNIKENSKISPKCRYSKNKLITEKKLNDLINDKLLIFRVSNVIGMPRNKIKNKVHWTFLDDFFKFAKKGIIFDNSNSYKDFISIKKLSEVVLLCIKKNILGVYNLSIGKKIYLNKLVKWLNYYNKKKCRVINSNKYMGKSDNFTLNNLKLSKFISLKYSINDLEKYCKKISKVYFRK